MTRLAEVPQDQREAIARTAAAVVAGAGWLVGLLVAGAAVGGATGGIPTGDQA